MQFFVKFIKKGLLYKASRLNPRHMEVILKLEDRLPDYRATIHRRTSHQVTTHKVDECYKCITPEDLRSVEQSEPAKSAVKLLGLAAEKKQLTFAEFTTVRDYLVVTTMYENGSRPGPVENALVSQFLQATYDAKTNRYTILVDKHKTTRHHGPAELTCTSRIYLYLQLYVLHVHSQFAAPGEDALFVKEDGQAYRPGTIGRRVPDFFQQAGIRSDIRVTATGIRKMISDKAFEMSPTKKCLIHSHMKHHESMANHDYVLKLNAERASKAHELVQGIIHHSGTSSRSAPSPAVAEKEGDILNACKIPTPLQAEPSTSYNDSDDDKPLGDILGKDRPKSSGEYDEAQPLRVKPTRVLESSDDSDPESGRHSVSSLQDAHKSVLLTVFADEIGAGKLLTMHEVCSKMRAHIFLRKMVVNADFVKKVADFVRYKTNHTRQLQLTKMSDWAEPEGIASLSIESGLRKVWSSHDTAVVEAKFKPMPKFPGKKEVLDIFANDQVLSHILKREGAVRCYEKVKNLFKRGGK